MTNARIIPFTRPAPARQPADYSHLYRYAYDSARSEPVEPLERMRGELHEALAQGVAERTARTLAELKRRVEELERKLSA